MAAPVAVATLLKARTIWKVVSGFAGVALLIFVGFCAMFVGAIGAATQAGADTPGGGLISGDWAHPLGYEFKWDTYPTGSHAYGAIDMPAPAGDPVYAASSGTVSEAGWSGTSYGIAVNLTHSGDVRTYYAHLSSVAVSQGQKVKAGQLIGTVGDTGGDWGAHLHFEVRQGGNSRSHMLKAVSFMKARGINLGYCYSDCQYAYLAGG